MDNLNNEYEIGELIKDTDNFGTVVVKDIFRSVAYPAFFCYRVETENGESFLCNEEDLVSTL